MEKIGIIVTAGGSGLRMGRDLPKQFIPLNGRPILVRTVEVFATLPIDMEIYVVLPPLCVELWKKLVFEYNMQTPHEVVEGGLTRFHSVRNALAQTGDEKITIVHDGVRPLVSQEMILRLLEAAQTHPAVIPVVEVSESMRRLEEEGDISTQRDGGRSVSVDRSQYRLVQTPQIFWTDTLKQAYKQSYVPSFTDDATVVEQAGNPLYFTQGELRNIKITTPEDLKLAELLAPPFVHSAVLDPDLTLDRLVKGD